MSKTECGRQLSMSEILGIVGHSGIAVFGMSEGGQSSLLPLFYSYDGCRFWLRFCGEGDRSRCSGRKTPVNILIQAEDQCMARSVLVRGLADMEERGNVSVTPTSMTGREYAMPFQVRCN